MRRINIHHFPQNPFQEQQFRYHHPYHSYPSHHHSNYHRRHSFSHSHYGTGSSHYGSLHMGHPHHGLLSSFASRTLKQSFDLVRLSRVHDQLNLPVPTPATTTDNNDIHGASSSDDQTPPSPSTPPPLQVPTIVPFSIFADEDRLLTSFLTSYLGRDGILVLYLLQMNTNEVITGEIVTALFEIFKQSIQPDTVD